LPRTIDPDSFGFLITDLTRLIRAEMDRLISEAGLGITPGDARTLSHVARAGAVKQAVLADRIGVEAMTLSSSLDRLEAAGLLERQPDPADRRANLVHLTEVGEALLARIKPLGVQMRRAAGEGVAVEDWNRLMVTMKQIRANLCAARDARKAVDAS